MGNYVAHTWDPGCPSPPGSYTRVFELPLCVEAQISIQLTSEDVDTYLRLLDGTNGRVLHSDDNGGEGTNSRILTTLERGYYLIEAVTFDVGKSANLDLALRIDFDSSSEHAGYCSFGWQVAGTPLSACHVERLGNIDVDGRGWGDYYWEYRCPSVSSPGHYAVYLAFTLARERRVTIELHAVVDGSDPYVYLFDREGRKIAEDDNAGSGTNSHLVRRLSAGTYIIEAVEMNDTASTDRFFAGFAFSDDDDPKPLQVLAKDILGLHHPDCPDRAKPCLFLTATYAPFPLGRYSAECYWSTAEGELLEKFASVVIEISSHSHSDLCHFNGTANGRYMTAIVEGVRSNSVGFDNAPALEEPGTTDNQPQDVATPRAVTISLGASLAAGDDNCTYRSNPCRWLNATYTGFPRGASYAGECYWSRSADQLGEKFASFTASVRGGSDPTLCYFNGMPGRYITAVVDGVHSNTVRFDGNPASQPLPHTDDCDPISLGVLTGTINRSGEWTEQCESSRRPGRYASHVDFTLDHASTLEVELNSETDTYLYLESGSGQLIRSDDDCGRETNARFRLALASGNYRLEATTKDPGIAGPFFLRISAEQSSDAGQAPSYYDCIETTALPKAWENVKLGAYKQLPNRRLPSGLLGGVSYFFSQGSALGHQIHGVCTLLYDQSETVSRGNSRRFVMLDSFAPNNGILPLTEKSFSASPGWNELATTVVTEPVDVLHVVAYFMNRLSTHRLTCNTQDDYRRLDLRGLTKQIRGLIDNVHSALDGKGEEDLDILLRRAGRLFSEFRGGESSSLFDRELERIDSGLVGLNDELDKATNDAGFRGVRYHPGADLGRTKRLNWQVASASSVVERIAKTVSLLADERAEALALLAQAVKYFDSATGESLIESLTGFEYQSAQKDVADAAITFAEAMFLLRQVELASNFAEPARWTGAGLCVATIIEIARGIGDDVIPLVEFVRGYVTGVLTLSPHRIVDSIIDYRQELGLGSGRTQQLLGYLQELMDAGDLVVGWRNPKYWSGLAAEIGLANAKNLLFPEEHREFLESENDLAKECSPE